MCQIDIVWLCYTELPYSDSDIYHSDEGGVFCNLIPGKIHIGNENYKEESIRNKHCFNLYKHDG